MGSWPCHVTLPRCTTGGLFGRPQTRPPSPLGRGIEWRAKNGETHAFGLRRPKRVHLERHVSSVEGRIRLVECLWQRGLLPPCNADLRERHPHFECGELEDFSGDNPVPNLDLKAVRFASGRRIASPVPTELRLEFHPRGLHFSVQPSGQLKPVSQRFRVAECSFELQTWRSMGWALSL